ncbi:hypothetical protein G8O24_08275 [Bradyrhizobium sp. INPA01-394B]|uniref:HEAT repeat domain-containing protein n=2 Tax=Bacteria TaxID=2 RepID=A0ABR7TXF9_9BRAD|nr:hypothetical protein [Bradyrhizobium campsiandrae]MBC9877340.1 hypothetical protein [Bradyrhizobium campsiandrae]MBC9976630.1 hypothetical protein [Bradyrhizobium campsiandrae]
MVRFDIRPLQEFFAGEFIYQSGEPDNFVDRVRTIAGDSHWREVVHFLLSALIENTRKSELAAAVTVLTQLDDGGDREMRALNRRLARGGIIASRLLQEGVLEQDKRLREQFRNCIVPLSGCVDAGRYFSTTKSLHSVQWLTDVLVSVLAEQAEPENIGALTCLTKILSDTDERSKLLKSTLVGASRGYQRSFLEQFRDSTRDSGEPRIYPRWLRESAVRLLLDNNWHDLGYAAVSAATSIFANGPDSKSIAREIGIDPAVVRLLDGLLPASIRDSNEPRSAAHVEVQYGIIEVQYFKPREIPSWKTWSPATWSKLSTSTGILKAIYCALNFVRSPNDETLTHLRVALAGDLRNCRMLPETIRAFFDFQQIELDGSNRRPSRLVRKSRPGYVMELMLRGGSKDGGSIDWLAIAGTEPWLALHLLARGSHDATKAFEDAKVQRLLLGHMPSETLLAYAAKWGTLFGLTEPLGTGLRELALSAAKGLVAPERFFDRMDHFKVELPKEAEMLPHLLAALVHSSSPESSLFHRELRHTSFEDIASTVRKIFRSGTSLRKIFQSTAFSTRVRAAAGVFYGFHSGGTSLQKEIDSLVELYDAAEASWFLPAVALLLNEALATEQRFALKAMGALLESANSNLPARFAVNPMVASWREISRAPVTQAAEPMLWK